MSGGGKKAKAKGKGKATTTASLSNTRKALPSGIGGLEEEEAQASTSASVFGYQAPNCEGIASLPFRLCRKESVEKVVKALVVTNGVVLIKAPPGSGKTSFIVRILSYSFPFPISNLKNSFRNTDFVGNVEGSKTRKGGFEIDARCSCK
jgi:HrpA-like RNA helicase